jgi:hypothetical protein
VFFVSRSAAADRRKIAQILLNQSIIKSAGLFRENLREQFLNKDLELKVTLIR